MSNFVAFSKSVHHAYATILKKDDGKKDNVFIVDVSGDELWAHYLASFPEGTNPMFRERTEHDCSCCRNFVKNLGAVVYVDGKTMHSVWDVKLNDDTYQTVADAMAELVKSKAISQHFLVGEPSYGAEKTDSKGEVWNHFYGKVPSIFVARNNDSNYVGNRRDDVAILKRSILEITDDAVEIVSDLIDQDSLYRGAEHKWAVNLLSKLKRKYNSLKTEREKEFFLWTEAKANTRIRNTVIGTLLTDISEGVELEIAVKKFEDKVAGTNYKRPKALVTQRMIDEAGKKVEELGLEDALARRYAVREDISVNDVLFVDGSVKPKLLGGAFDSIKPTKKDVPQFKDVEDISIKDFLKNVLPKADSVEVFVKNAHISNFVSLIAPVNAEAKPLFKWDNAFSWSYDGEVTDSIRERVKKAGGKVDGDVRISLSWHNADDLDLSVTRDNGECLYFGNKRAFGAELDVDMNAFGVKNNIDPVENIFWANRSSIKQGRYEISVHNYTKRSTANVGYEVEIEVMGKLYSFIEPKDLGNQKRAKVGVIVVSKTGEITIEGLREGNASKEHWGVNTEQWTPVDLITRSPNFWGDKSVGNEHVFFMLKGCVNQEGTRGFYNEYLRDELTPHRKVFEVVSSKMKVAYSENQLSGIGFSVTKRDELQVRVKGAINRVLNVKF